MLAKFSANQSITNLDLSNEQKGDSDMNHSNGSHQEFIDSVHRIFTERGYQEVAGKSALDEQYLLFTRNDALHLVYCLSSEMYVTTVEVQACWEAQCRLGAKSSSVAAPGRFSEAAFDKAWKLEIELLPVENG